MLINVFNLQVTVENFIRILTGRTAEIESNQVMFTCAQDELVAFLAAQRLLIQSIN